MTNEELAKRIQDGDEALLLELWNQVRGFVARQARRRYVLTNGLGGVEIEDLVQSGYIALVEAVRSYDPMSGYPFIAYLRTTLKTAFSEAGGYRSSRQFHDPLHTAASLDVPIGDDDDSGDFVDFIPDDRDDYEDADERIYHEQLHDCLDDALATLSEKQSSTIRRRYYDGMTLREVGHEDGVSIERVRQREKDGLRTLKRQKNKNGLAQFIEEHRRELDALTPWYLNIGVDTFTRTHTSAVEALVIKREKNAEIAYNQYRRRLEKERSAS